MVISTLSANGSNTRNLIQIAGAYVDIEGFELQTHVDVVGRCNHIHTNPQGVL